MYLYQRARQKQYRKIKVMLILGFTSVLLFFAECETVRSRVLKSITKVMTEEMVGYCIPMFAYYESPASQTGVQDYILEYFFPILSESREMISYQTTIESEFSYEMILAMEAADENYVDAATGEVVGDMSVAELTLEISTEQVDDGMLEQIEQAVSMENAQVQTEAEAMQVVSQGKVQKAVTYSREKLADFDYLIQNFYRVDKTTTINGGQLNAADMLAKDMTLTHDASSPQILIYHTHSQEAYADSVPGDASTTIVGVGAYLTRLLQEQYGLNVIHHTGEYDVETRDDAYSRAGPAVEKILAENPGIEVVIDLHRDGVGENTRLVTNIEGVDMAKIMFVNGLSRTTSVGDIGYLYNPNLADNLAFSFHNQLAMAEYYPGLSRGVYLKGYRYNLHYCPKSLLVEVGAQTNTVQEAMNAMVPLADVINKVVTTKD